MAVYERRLGPWTGALTPAWSRFLVLPRYAFKDVFRTRLITQLFVVSCVAWPFFCLVVIYLRYNVDLLKALELPGHILPKIDARFFLLFLDVQGAWAAVIALLVGPGLISADTRNAALPLYFARPLSRFEYVLGKAAVLAALLSLVTWVPGLAVFAANVILSKGAAPGVGARIPAALVAGSAVLIAVLSLSCLAVSACVKRKPVAQAFLVIGFVLLSTFGSIGAEGLQWEKAGHLRPESNMQAVWRGLLGLSPSLDPVAAVAVLLFAVAGAALLLARRIRPMEVVR